MFKQEAAKRLASYKLCELLCKRLYIIIAMHGV